MADYLDATLWRETRTGKRYAVRIGYATAKSKGDGYYVTLDALPTADKEGRVSFEIAPRREQPAQRTGGTVSRRDDLDDDIPW